MKEKKTQSQKLPSSALKTHEAKTHEASTHTMRNHGFLFFLTLLNVMNFVDRQILASFANFIVPDLGLSNTEFGLLTGLVFIFFYATMGLFAGSLADRVHRPRLIASGVFLWSLLTAASGAARGFASLAIARMFIGIGESVLTPSSMSMLSDRFKAHQLGFAAGFYYMGVPIGVGVSLLVAGYLGPLLGWRGCFYLLGGIGILLAGCALLMKENPNHGAHYQTQSRMERRSAIKDMLKYLKTSPVLALTITGGVALHFILGAAAFDQLWLVQERGFDKAEIARIVGWISVFMGILGNLFGGIGSDLWKKWTGQARPLFLFWVMLILTPINLVYRVVEPESIWFWIGLGAGFFQLGAFYGPTFATIQELSPIHTRSTMTAFYILLLNLIGLGIGVTGGGIMIDWLANAGVAEPYSITLFTFTAISGLAIPFFGLAGLYQNKQDAALGKKR